MEITFIISIFSFAVLIAYLSLIMQYGKSWKQLAIVENQQVTSSPLKTTVSIIIAARNEEENILNLLNAIANQNYATALFEIIIVDDNSEDRTVEVIKKFRLSHPELFIQLLQLQNLNSLFQGKKAAINEGIKISKNELIVTTDADCVMQKNWLITLVAYYEMHQPKMIAGPVLLSGDSIFQQLQQLEFLSLMGTTAAAIKANRPLMCNGANLAYSRTIFEEVGGFNSNQNIATGDDTFLMFEIWKKYKDGVHFLKSNDAVVTTEANKQLKAFLQQRIRWASKTNQYKINHVSCVGYLLMLTNMVILASAALAIINSKSLLLCFVLFCAKLICDYIFLSAVAQFFNRKDVMNPFLFLVSTLLYPFYIFIVGIKSQRGSYKWKGRII